MKKKKILEESPLVFSALEGVGSYKSFSYKKYGYMFIFFSAYKNNSIRTSSLNLVWNFSKNYEEHEIWAQKLSRWNLRKAF